jgi:hypothetical protein
MNTRQLNQTLESTRKSGKVSTDFFEELLVYERIILRGAGSFGSEIGRQLLEKGIPKEKLLYWDLRATEVTDLHGISVKKTIF